MLNSYENLLILHRKVVKSLLEIYVKSPIELNEDAILLKQILNTILLSIEMFLLLNNLNF